MNYSMAEMRAAVLREGNKRKAKIVSEKWYRRNRATLNKKLRQAIMDSLPFTMDEKLADIVLHTIFDTIYEGVMRDGKVSIAKFGRFTLAKTPYKVTSWRKKPYVPTYKVKFRLDSRLYKKMRFEEIYGNSGESEGT